MIRIFALSVLIAGLAFAVQAALGQQAGIKRTELQRHDLGIPGREAVQVRIDFDAGAAFPKHTHPGEEIIYVIEGTLEYQVAGQATVTLKAGGVLFIPAGTIHSARNVGSNRAAELGTYIVEKGKPLVALVQSASVSKKELRNMIISSIQFTFAAKDADTAESMLRELSGESIKEPGVVRFDVGRGSDDRNVFVLWEVYRDNDAVDAHRESEPFKRLVLNGIRPLAQKREVITAVPVNEDQ
jgi:quercetin dioxygenase-like cupin family protein/quinol monooxygenase YgiN